MGGSTEAENPSPHVPALSVYVGNLVRELHGKAGGMLKPSAFKSRHKNAPRPPEKSAPAFIQWLRGRPCACAGCLCDGTSRIVAAHVDHAGGKGMGTKVADRHAIPLSNDCHRLQHSIGWRTYEQRLCSDAVKLAEEYWRRWPGRIAWEAKQNV